ncbi:flagellar export chaperone FliS [Bythopirellula polymerisocia]|uniref:Flagellar protein FliS n=1 Tax=Bythopirellula polymerisocia TaxID=2528003 RepID=A0A5C6CQ64_9BACT|nr:flagellar export chaperone FliS [Bythopirellula polymerisocia]TWU25561.1 flagellar protein FliS [Bythopirellula polymerisocia]
MQQPGQNYLDSKILTASQPRLQLMLIEGAVRFGKQAQQSWQDGAEFASIDQSLSRVAEILEELIRSAASGKTDLSELVENHYASIYRELANCRINQAADKLDACLELLQYHRETWKQVCQKLESEVIPKHSPVKPHIALDQSQACESFSLEA